jgi:hypothetical protein
MHTETPLPKIICIKTSFSEQNFQRLASAHQKCLLFFLLLSILFMSPLSPAGHAKDFLIDREIELLQNTQSVATRTRIYMDAAALRLKTMKDKLSNKEYEAGDPMELLMPEEVIDAYCKILRSVQLIMGYAVEAPNRRGHESAAKALKTVNEETKKALTELSVLRKMAEEKESIPLSDSINDAMDITTDLLKDADEKITRLQLKNPR